MDSIALHADAPRLTVCAYKSIVLILLLYPVSNHFGSKQQKKQ